MSAAVTMLRLKQPSHPIVTIRAWHGCARPHRSRTCSSSSRPVRGWRVEEAAMRGPEHGQAAVWRRIWAMIVKEIVQLRRDRITLANMIAVPVFQLTLYGYAINTNPKHLPTAIMLQESSDVGRSVLAALQNSE